jgi:hypothetical protein
MGKSTLLATTLGLLAIGANAGAVDLTESDFDAQVFESGKVRPLWEYVYIFLGARVKKLDFVFIPRSRFFLGRA